MTISKWRREAELQALATRHGWHITRLGDTYAVNDAEMKDVITPYASLEEIEDFLDGKEAENHPDTSASEA